MKNNYYKNIPGKLKEFVPEFETTFDKEDIYPAMFEFGQFILSNFDNKELLQRSALFINDALEFGESLVEDLVVMQVFQQIYGDEKLFTSFKAQLSAKASLIFDRSYKEYKKFYN